MKAATTAVITLVVIVYAVVGGVVFNLLEKDHETAVQQDVTIKLDKFLGTLRIDSICASVFISFC